MLELDPKYRVIDDSWQNYPSAVSVQQLVQIKQGIQPEPEYEADSLLAQIALSVGKDISSSSELNNEELVLMAITSGQANGIITYLEQSLKLNFDVSFKDERFWLLGKSDQKFMSGFCNHLLINEEKRLGVIVRHYLGKTIPVPVRENKELQTLALIVAEAFNLESIVVASLWISSNTPSLHLYTSNELRLFKEELQLLLRHIH
jgi:hypothetical protein